MSRTSAVRVLASAIAFAIAALGALPPEHVHAHASTSTTVHRHFTSHTHHAPSSLHDADDDDARVLPQAFAGRPFVRLHPVVNETTLRVSSGADRPSGRVPFTPFVRLVHGPPGSTAAFRAPPFQPDI